MPAPTARRRTAAVSPTVLDGPVETVTYRLELPAPSFTSFSLHLKGTSPLILDAFGDARKKRFAGTQDGSPKPKKGPRDPGAEFREGMYIMADGRYGIPKLAFRKAIQSAAIRMTEIKGTEVLAAFQIAAPDELLPLECSEPEMRTDNVVRQMTANLSYRPMYREWAVWLPVKLDHEVVSLDQFLHIVNKAGMGVGVGNWRPEKKGDFGCWVIDDISEVTKTTRVQVAAQAVA